MRSIAKFSAHLVCWCAVLASSARAGDSPPAAGSSPGAPAASAQSPGEACPLSVDEIIARYAQASGGPALRKMAAEKRSGTILRGQAGRMPVETTAAAPGRWCYHQTFSFGDQVVFGCDGAGAWIQDTKEIGPMDPRQQRDFELLLDPQASLRIREIYPLLEAIGTEVVGDRPACTVRATTDAGDRTELAFDRETGLLLRCDQMLFEDYRETDGVTRPFRVLLGETDPEHHLQMKLEFTTTVHNVDVDQDVFHRPATVLPITEAPLYKDHQEVPVSLEAMDACVGVYQHPDKSDVTYSITRWQDHLMIQRTGWPVPHEIKPASETEYFIRFPGTDFRFIKDDNGRIAYLDIANGAVKATRIE
jgi:hypothetical protein